MSRTRLLLGQIVSLLEIDLNQFIGRDTFIVPYSLVYNRTFIDNISALLNSRANRYMFLDS